MTRDKHKLQFRLSLTSFIETRDSGQNRAINSRVTCDFLEDGHIE